MGWILNILSWHSQCCYKPVIVTLKAVLFGCCSSACKLSCLLSTHLYGHLWIRRHFVLHRNPMGKPSEETASESKCRAGEMFQLKWRFKWRVLTTRTCILSKTPQAGMQWAALALSSLSHCQVFWSQLYLPYSIKTRYVKCGLQCVMGKQVPQGKGWRIQCLNYSSDKIQS